MRGSVLLHDLNLQAVVAPTAPLLPQPKWLGANVAQQDVEPIGVPVAERYVAVVRVPRYCHRDSRLGFALHFRSATTYSGSTEQQQQQQPATLDFHLSFG